MLMDNLNDLITNTAKAEACVSKKKNGEEVSSFRVRGLYRRKDEQVTTSW